MLTLDSVDSFLVLLLCMSYRVVDLSVVPWNIRRRMPALATRFNHGCSFAKCSLMDLHAGCSVSLSDHAP